MTNAWMKPILFALLALIVLLLSAAFVLGERPFAIPFVLLIAGIWGVLLWRNGRRPPSWPMLLLLLLTALANVPLPQFPTPVPLLWRYLAAIALLLLWDLSRFDHRLQDVPGDEVANARPLIVAHLRRLGGLVALALIALALQQFLPLAFDFDLALISGLLLIFGLNALLRRLQMESA
ncbi:MAG: hypothetical protein KC445_10870 [Anaerolineales bacterium]|nr:hypothetical protein [Anaerolineales bacterium]